MHTYMHKFERANTRKLAHTEAYTLVNKTNKAPSSYLEQKLQEKEQAEIVLGPCKQPVDGGLPETANHGYSEGVAENHH